jgi:pimeloyl-ACP methyl ester carboxylesterase
MTLKSARTREEMISADSRNKTYVLVHGGFHGSWAWKDVAFRLRALGHTVYTPTLTGLGERSHLMAIKPTLDIFIEDVAQVLRFEDLEDVILVGHSFAGSVVSGVADRMADRLRHLVYLDAIVLKSGQSPMDLVDPGMIERYRQRAYATSGGLTVPPNEPDYFGILDPVQAAWLKTKLSPHPFQTYLDKLALAHELGNGVPVTYIACTNPALAATSRSRELAQSLPGWTYLEIPTAHNAMMLMPAELTSMLAAID